MRIALFHDTPRIGGAELYLKGLCRGLAGEGIEVHLVVPDGVMVEYARERIGDAAALHILPPRPAYSEGLTGNLRRTVTPLLRLRAAFEAIRPDILHVNNGGFPGSHLARAAVFATTRPRVMTVNSTAQARKARLRQVYELHDRAIWQRVACVVCPAADSGAVLVERRGLPSEKVRVIPYGIDVPEEPADASDLRRALAPDGELTVGMVVSPDTNPEVRYKGHDVLLEALGRTRERRIHAVFVGHDPGDAFRRRAAELGVADRLVFHAGYRPSLPYLYAMDVLAIPSTRYESLPLVCLEAMGAGTPVVASRLAGLPEALDRGEAGLLFEPGDADALALLLDRLAAEPQLRRRLSQRGRMRFSALYSLERMTEATVGVYAEVIERSSRRATKRPAIVPARVKEVDRTPRPGEQEGPP